MGVVIIMRMRQCVRTHQWFFECLTALADARQRVPTSPEADASGRKAPLPRGHERGGVWGACGVVGRCSDERGGVDS